jgi:hypothetical protein
MMPLSFGINADISKAKHLLGYDPEWILNVGLNLLLSGIKTIFADSINKNARIQGD